jgi:hypothetical protein
MHPDIQKGLENLDLPQYEAIKSLFGQLLVRRAQQADPRCGLFQRLAEKNYIMKPLNDECATYVRELGLSHALRKLRENVSGHVKRPQDEFQQRIVDFNSEITAVNLMSRQGAIEFRAIHQNDPSGLTIDYLASRRGEPLSIEVKNLRTNDTALDIANYELAQLYAAEPELFPFHAVLTFYDDEPPSAEQERRIEARVRSWRGRTPPFRDTLDLLSGQATFEVQAGEGRVIGVRGWSAEQPATIDKPRFIGRVRATAEKAKWQMRMLTNRKVLVLGFNPPSYDISGEFLEAAAQEIDEVFERKVEAHFLLHGHELSPSPFVVPDSELLAPTKN